MLNRYFAIILGSLIKAIIKELIEGRITVLTLTIDATLTEARLLYFVYAYFNDRAKMMTTATKILIVMTKNNILNYFLVVY